MANEIQRVTLDAAIFTGHFTLDLQDCASFDAATIDAALEASYGVGNILATDVSSLVVTVEFTGSLANQSHSLLAFSASNTAKQAVGNPSVNVTQTGIADSSGSVTPTFSTTTEGDGATSEVQRVDFDHVPDSGTWEITSGMATTNPLQYNASAFDVQTEVDSAFGSSVITVAGSVAAGFTFTWILPGNQDVLAVTMNSLTYSATGRHEIFTVTLPALTDYGSWKLTKNGSDETTGIQWDASSGAITVAGFNVTGGSSPWTFESSGNVAAATWGAVRETLGKPATASVTRDQAGHADFLACWACNSNPGVT